MLGSLDESSRPPFPRSDRRRCKCTIHDADVHHREFRLYVLDGALLGANDSVSGPGTLVVLTPGDRVSIAATPDEVAPHGVAERLPMQGPVLFSGLFVVDAPGRLAQARGDFASGNQESSPHPRIDISGRFEPWVGLSAFTFTRDGSEEQRAASAHC